MSAIKVEHVPGLQSPPFQPGDSRGEHIMLYIAPVVRSSSRFWSWVYALAMVVDALVINLPRATAMYVAHRWRGGCSAGVSCRLLHIRVTVEPTS